MHCFCVENEKQRHWQKFVLKRHLLKNILQKGIAKNFFKDVSSPDF
jgi:hypothetical protein